MEFVPQVDLFATKENRLLRWYVFPVEDDQAMVVVAFSIPWNNWESIFVFPPFSLLLRVLCPITLQWETHSHSSPMAQSALVSYTVLISKFKYHHQILNLNLSQIVGIGLIFITSNILSPLHYWVCWSGSSRIFIQKPVLIPFYIPLKGRHLISTHLSGGHSVVLCIWKTQRKFRILLLCLS